MKKLCIALSLSIWFLLSGVAQAITIEWTLNDVVFTDGGTASGSFLYDTDTSTYSNVSIVTTAGSIRSATQAIEARGVVDRRVWRIHRCE